VVWIRIRKDLLDPHPDPHQIKFRNRIRIKIYKLDPEPDPHQFADVKPKCMEYEPILAAAGRMTIFTRQCLPDP
jgi:hypothetical protein